MNRRQSRVKYLLKVFFIYVLTLVVLVSVVPYLVPLSHYDGQQNPFDNSVHFEVDGSSIHYRIFAPETAELKGKILLVHGLGGSTFSYQQTVGDLVAEGFFVVAVDLPGFGYSSRNLDENHSQRHRALLLWQLLDYLDSQQVLAKGAELKWHLAGHSMGGGTVAAMTIVRQPQVASMVFIAGALFQTNRARGNMVAVPVVQRWLQVLLEHAVIKPDRIETFLTSAYGRAPEPHEIRGYYHPLSTAGTARSVPALIRTAENISEEALSQIRVPAFAIWGANDTWVPPDNIQRIKALMPQLESIVIADVGHCPMETHPQEFNEQLLAWLNQL